MGLSLFCKNFHVLENLLSFHLYFLSLYRMLLTGNHKKETSLFQKTTMREAFLWKEIQENADGNA